MSVIISNRNRRRRHTNSRRSISHPSVVVYNNDSDDSDDSASDTDNSYALEVYSRDELLATTSSAERLYLKSRPGICAGMTLAWLQQIVLEDVQPRSSWPDVSYSRSLQEHIEHHYIRHHSFPDVGGMADEGTYRFSSVDSGLSYVWNRSGSYMLLIRPRYGRIGHAVAYSDKYSWPNGYLMNPNKGNHCCFSYSALARSFRSDRFIRFSETSLYGPEFIVIRIGKKLTIQPATDDDNDGDDDEDEDQAETDSNSDTDSADYESENDAYVDENENGLDDNEDEYDDSESDSDNSSSGSSSDDSDYYAEYEASTNTEYVHYAAFI